jgi:hypothetical protein
MGKGTWDSTGENGVDKKQVGRVLWVCSMFV